MLDDGTAAERFEQMRTPAPWDLRHSAVPVRDERAQLIAEREQFFDALIQLFEAFTHERPTAEARRAALVPNRQHAFQVGEGKTYDERPLDERDALDRRGRVLPVPGRVPGDSRKKPLPLIVPKGV